jgi:hypothetical protein
MTSNRSPTPRGHRSATAGIALVLSLGTALAIAAATACSGSDDTTTNNYIGVTDATPPRLGSSDGGAR